MQHDSSIFGERIPLQPSSTSVVDSWDNKSHLQTRGNRTTRASPSMFQNRLEITAHPLWQLSLLGPFIPPAKCFVVASPHSLCRPSPCHAFLAFVRATSSSHFQSQSPPLNVSLMRPATVPGICIPRLPVNLLWHNPARSAWPAHQFHSSYTA